jgi:hypothetical protein
VCLLSFGPTVSSSSFLLGYCRMAVRLVVRRQVVVPVFWPYFFWWLNFCSFYLGVTPLMLLEQLQCIYSFSTVVATV